MRLKHREDTANSVICTLWALQSLHKNMHYTSQVHIEADKMPLFFLFALEAYMHPCSEVPQMYGQQGLDPARQNLTEAMTMNSEQFDHLALWWEVKWFSELRAVQHICVCGKFS